MRAVDAVVIGRNEGERLRICLQSVIGQVRRVVYVDSGSTDGSVALAQSLGARVVQLDLAQPFTAARARNAGWRALRDDRPEFVQFVDGDCEMRPRWIASAVAALEARPAAVVVCGRRREKAPETSVFNRLADREWDTPIGPALACGGDALMRFAALEAVDGFRDDLIAGEEPELCQRLRRNGGEIWRIDEEMTLHDAAMTRFSQWWRRSRRAGFAFAEGAALHGGGPDRHWVTETRRALVWGAVLPLAILLGGVASPVLWLAVLIYPLQMLRLVRRGGVEWAAFTVLGKFAEARGVMEYHLRRLSGRRRGLIEYK